MSMAAVHSLVSLLALEESSSNSEDSLVLGFAVAAEHCNVAVSSTGPYMHEPYVMHRLKNQQPRR